MNIPVTQIVEEITDHEYSSYSDCGRDHSRRVKIVSILSVLSLLSLLPFAFALAVLAFALLALAFAKCTDVHCVVSSWV